MLVLVLGLVVFLGMHSLRIVSEPLRDGLRERLGPVSWRVVYSLVSALGLALIVWGYGLARQDPMVLWMPPIGMRHAAALLTLVAFVLLVAAYVPGNAIKARLHHPMLLGTKVWALAHLLSNGTLADVLLFGGFLLWAVLGFRAARQRDRRDGTVYGPARMPATVATVVLGIGAWAAFAFWAHAALIGVAPMGR
ncbi:NnrU family protein [Acidovorax lacteus]|uniref:NnrU family protein n=1 Tax=Acidovorax lacteus TaxID=1924988 RepID=A0ABP8LI79_9BURK